MKGLVYKSTGSWYIVKDEAGKLWNARVKGKLKIDEDISSTNPIAVGDVVVCNVEEKEEGIATIKSIAPRNNYIVRVSPHNKNQKHIVASNLDAALVVATIAEPRTSSGFIDRFLITAEAYHIPAIIVINKTDLLQSKHMEQLLHWQQVYTDAGYEVYPIIALQPDTITTLSDRLKGLTTLFSGHSGVGKSTLINQLIPGVSLRTQEVSGWSGKGQHTTTFAEMFDMPDGGKIIDTPGVKEFGLIDFEKEELAQYFPEMRRVMQQCRFNNCLHINEPGCAVKQAVNDESISIDRYASYMTILDTIEKKW
ncbi:ribosome small subunit-dependent GTPase A [Chitinophagaceae bacterium IBVUCB1]|nr:ribosome small subunit-dependent GTPase A [Chitinophagaceae bacterium IBVUCB1]